MLISCRLLQFPSDLADPDAGAESNLGKQAFGLGRLQEA
jgi:hypothetical protein